MEKEQVERLLNLFLKMLTEHPELCPHDWEFCYSYPNIKNGKYGRTYEYRCGICGEHKFEFKEGEYKMKRLRKVLPNTQETKEHLNSLPKIYLIACWAKWGVIDFPFTGKYKYDKFRAYKKVPLVYQYDDHNGTDDNYYLRPITYTTTGAIDSWTFDRDEAYRIAEKKNKETKI